MEKLRKFKAFCWDIVQNLSFWICPLSECIKTVTYRRLVLFASSGEEKTKEKLFYRDPRYKFSSRSTRESVSCRVLFTSRRTGIILRNVVGLMRSGKVQSSFCEPAVLEFSSLQTPYKHITRLRVPDISTFTLSAYLLEQIRNCLFKLF
jgi:hypothetical protein